MPPQLLLHSLLQLRVPPRHPLLRLLHSYNPIDRPPPQDPPLHDAELWIAKALATAALLLPHYLPAFRRLAPSQVAAAAALRHAPCASSTLHLFSALHSPHSQLAIPPSAHSYRYVISLMCQSGRHTDALQLFDQMTDQSGYFPNARFLSFLSGSCATAGLLDAAAALLSKASQFGCSIEAYAYNKLMGLFIGRGRVQEAVALFEGWIQGRVYSPDTWSFNVIIKGVCKVGDVQKALELVERMDEFGCSPDTVTHNILVNGLCRAKEVSKGREVLRRLQRDGVCKPNVVTYTSVISGYCKAGRMGDAMAVYDDMVACGTSPNVVTYNVLINGYGKAGNMGYAVAVYQQMILRRCLPDVVTFSSLIDGYCRCGQLDDAMKIWTEMSQYHIQPNAHTFCIIIHTFCKQNRSGEALHFLKKMNIRTDIAPQAFIYNPVIDVLCKGGKVDEANMILMEMEEKGCHPDKYTYTILIIGHCMKGRIAEAITFFHKMVETGCTPDSIVVNSFISCLLKSGMPGEVDHIMRIAAGGASSSWKDPSPVTQSVDISVAV
ncbi:pentatricopeptide repeat-containing protein At2g06000 [Triticum urartu]|uniref:Pentatricopeptide repeat-containing protein n=1 Tax=Triticum urartu TaxID=4572 RepID=A0A8R7TIX0_TRIUA|nr:pentatricopeptide repeat-containing protein At2g06000 [Triticum urartu]XP_048557620.1 pentatricopeptide repeat-containing protein At2g06000 [Triticum urartu]XP_048557621.1 pentatricopeptide repeat-containing protein At2g06000 [Triticum urartu]XP_048557622.1 pentatricopeptide repeat-containing protein At2g06000 [Triticum urartu]